MKKILRYLLYVVGAVLLFVAGFAIYVQITGIPSYEAKELPVVVTSTPEKVIQGKKLAAMLCVKCHYDEATGKLTGHYLNDIPKMFGEIYSKNITQHEFYGIGKWTDGQLAYFLRTGIRPDGKYLPPYMPKFVKLADSDMESIIAWLRSDDPMLQASTESAPASKPSWFTKFLSHVAFKPLPYDEKPIAFPDTNDAVAHGKYLATQQVQCFPCHSADFTKMDELNPEKSLGFFGGGNSMLDMEGKEIFTANITMDKETGIGNWTEEEFVKAVRFGQAPNRALLYPMEPYVQLTETEIKHIYAYLKTVPVIVNKVKRRN